MKCSILFLVVVAAVAVALAETQRSSLAKCTPELAGTKKVCGSDNFQVPNSCYGCALNCGNRHYKYSEDYILITPTEMNALTGDPSERLLIDLENFITLTAAQHSSTILLNALTDKVKHEYLAIHNALTACDTKNYKFAENPCPFTWSEFQACTVANAASSITTVLAILLDT
ncbi:hypothetical protein BV898_18014 [Hypsibius exemplaris]|uniref:Uncharacterized protein n=1 Tax=Hypsibius exemplaris TaxID=2072580 RepID=A0A9X6NIM4_HYPEX|nr:hypothetical protein BV898_18014 [Hypsibius exemplaris]